MKFIPYIALIVALASTGCEDDYFSFYDYPSESSDTIVHLRSAHEGTDSACLMLEVSENLYDSDEISLHFCEADTTIQNFTSKNIETYIEDSVEIPLNYYFVFDVPKSFPVFSLDTAVTIIMKSKSQVIFKATIERDSRSISSGWDIPVFKTCVMNPDKGRKRSSIGQSHQ